MNRSNIRFVLCLALICWTAAVVPASAQHFQLMEGSLTQIAAGRAEVWGLNGSQPYRFNPSTKKFVKIPGSLTQIAVGGGALLQPDEVWGINASGYVYQYNFSTKAFTYVTGGKQCKYCINVSFTQIVVGEGDYDSTGCHPYEVWGLSNLGTNRYNYCTAQFDLVPLPPGQTAPFTQIATGGGDILGYDTNANIWQFAGWPGWTVPEWVLLVWSPLYAFSPQQMTVGVGVSWAITNFSDGPAVFLTAPAV